MRCTLREWRLSDAKALAKALSNINIQNNLRGGLPYPYTEKDAEEYIIAMLSSDKNKVFAFAICVDDKAVGSIGAFRQSNIHYRAAELGYYLAEEYWGKGIMTSVAREFCKFVFENYDINRIDAEVFADNIGSRKVLEKIGFEFEGLHKKKVYKDGKFMDEAVYALIKK